MARPLRIVLTGAGGRMGRQVAELAYRDFRFAVVGGVDRPGVPSPGDFPYGTPRRLPELLRSADMLVDFSLPKASLSFAREAAKARVACVTGTTGFTPAQARSLRVLARRIALFVSPNMSPGMNLLFSLAARAAAALPGYDAAISETHHTLKKDAPSGSALRLAEAVRGARPNPGPVPTVSLRAGDVIGDHTLLLAGPDERVELTHRAQSRAVFARGALQAALWLARRRPGLYTMRDMLGL
ncbi:MAG: dihydrodipicolinate reductase C-terminal domain-containing protein [Elusimicrobiota bacterium]